MGGRKTYVFGVAPRTKMRQFYSFCLLIQHQLWFHPNFCTKTAKTNRPYISVMLPSTQLQQDYFHKVPVVLHESPNNLVALLPVIIIQHQLWFHLNFCTKTAKTNRSYITLMLSCTQLQQDYFHKVPVVLHESPNNLVALLPVILIQHQLWFHLNFCTKTAKTNRSYITLMLSCTQL